VRVREGKHHKYRWGGGADEKEQQGKGEEDFLLKQVDKRIQYTTDPCARERKGETGKELVLPEKA